MSDRLSKVDRQRLAQLRREVYDRIPQAGCRGLCAEACGLIPMTDLEHRRVVELTGRAPSFDGGACSLLVGGRCSVYRDRPTICRLFGVAEGLTCPHGCAPARELPRDEVAELLARAAELGGGPSEENMAALAAALGDETP